MWSNQGNIYKVSVREMEIREMHRKQRSKPAGEWPGGLNVSPGLLPSPECNILQAT